MELTLMTYNIHKGVGNDRLYKLDRIIQVCRDANADLMALQEVAHNIPRAKNHDMARMIAAELGMFCKLGLNVQLKRGAYGNAILSRYPIYESSNLNITWKRKKARGCLNAIVRLPRADIAVMNLHLGLAEAEREKQILKILSSQFLHSCRDMPVVLLGDSNDRRHKLDGPITQAGFSDTCPAVRPKTFPAYTPVWRLDKIYINEHWSLKDHRVLKDKKTRIASDHLPVLVRLKI